MNAKQLKQLIDREILNFRKARAEEARKAKRDLAEHRSDIHYVLDQASKGKAVEEG
jgi:hypothetical protein